MKRVKKPVKGKAPRARGRWLRKGDLAKALGISRPTLDGYLNRTNPPPPAPNEGREWNVEAVAAYIEANGTKVTTTDDMRALRETLLRTQAEDAQIDLSVKRGKLIAKASIEPGVSTVMTWWSEQLQAVFEGELPPKYKGKDTVEQTKLNADAVDRLMREFKEKMTALAEGKEIT